MNSKGEGHKLLVFDVIKRKIRVNRAKRPPRGSTRTDRQSRSAVAALFLHKVGVCFQHVVI